jgi:hypothetical protein
LPTPTSFTSAQSKIFPAKPFPSTLPDHPGQRQTELHAVTLLGSGVLDKPLDQHREVSAILIGDPAVGVTIEQLVERYMADPDAALRQWGHKENGHTRAFIWNLGNGTAAPETLRCTVYAATDKEAATQSYNAVDSLTAVKTRKDIMQSTLRIAGIQPASAWLQKASSLATALDLAVAVLCGGRNHPTSSQRLVLMGAREPALDATEMKMHRLLPHLIAVQRFKKAIEIFDRLSPTSALMPLSQSAFVAGYLSILHRDPDDGGVFLEALQTESGEYAGGLMDAFYAIKKVGEEVLDPRHAIKTTSGQRTEQILACVLNAYEGWRNDHSFKADRFPIRATVITRFNPILRKAADALMAAERAQRIKDKEQRAAEKRKPAPGGRLVRHRQRQSILPPQPDWSRDEDRPMA